MAPEKYAMYHEIKLMGRSRQKTCSSLSKCNNFTPDEAPTLNAGRSKFI